MSKHLDSLRDKVAKLCGRTDVPEPGEFLASLMSGTDPRPRSNTLHKYISKLVKEYGPECPPSPEEWEAIQYLVLDSGLYEREPVSLEVSVQSANKLMDFLHAKLKSLEVSADVQVKTNMILTDAEIQRFYDVWNNQY